MHACLNVDEIIRLVARELVASGRKGSATALACSCKNLKDPVLDVLWEAQDQLRSLLKSFPADVWNEEGGNFVSTSTTFRPLITELFDWPVFQTNPNSRGMDPLPGVRSKNPNTLRKSHSRPPTPGCSLDATTSHSQHTLASRSGSFCVSRNHRGVHPIHLFVSLP